MADTTKAPTQAKPASAKGERTELPPAEIHDPDPSQDAASELFGQMDDLTEMVQSHAPIPGISTEQVADPSKDPLGLSDDGTQEGKETQVIEEPEPEVQPVTEPTQPEPTKPSEPQPDAEEPDESAEDTIARLRQRVIELSTGTAPTAPPTPQTPTTPPPQQQPTQAPPQQQAPPVESQQFQMQGDVVQFVKDQEAFQQALSSPENFNKFLTQQSAFTVEQMIRAMTTLVPQLMQRTMTHYEAKQEFLRENPDLVPVQSYLARKVNEYSAAHPEETDILKAFQEGAKATRRDLALARKAAASNGGDGAPTGGQNKPQQPAFAVPGGTRKAPASTPQAKGIQSEIDDLIG